MKTIKTRADYDRIRAILDQVVDRDRKLPENVFIPDYPHLAFMDLAYVHDVTFYDGIHNYLTSVGEKGFWVSAIEPDPIEFFHHHFGFYGAFEFSNEDTKDDYKLAMFDTPQGYGDTLIAVGFVLAIGPYSNEWVIYGEIDAELAICAFKDRDAHAKFETAFETAFERTIFENICDAAEAVDYAYGEALQRGDLQQRELDAFIQNYSRG